MSVVREMLPTLVTVAGVILAAGASFLIGLLTVRATRRGQDITASSATQQRDIEALRAVAEAASKASDIAVRNSECAARRADEAHEAMDRMRSEMAAARDESRTALRIAHGLIAGLLSVVDWHEGGAKPPPPPGMEDLLRHARALLQRSQAPRAAASPAADQPGGTGDAAWASSS